VTAALIALAVIAFFALDALIIWLVVRGQRRAGRYGSVAVPAEIRVALPEGRVNLTYQEAVHSSGGGDTGSIDFYVPGELRVSVTPTVGATPLELKESTGHNASTMVSFFPGGPRSRVRIGHVMIPAAGDYVLRAEGEVPGAVAPTVLAG
jgi:hypothetical protein